MEKIPYSSESAWNENGNVFVENESGYKFVEIEESKTSQYDSKYCALMEISEGLLQNIFKNTYEISIGFLSAFHSHFDLKTNRARNERLEKNLREIEGIEIKKFQALHENGTIEEFFMVSVDSENVNDFMNSLQSLGNILYKTADSGVLVKVNLKSGDVAETRVLKIDTILQILHDWKGMNISGYYIELQGMNGALVKNHLHKVLTGESLGNVVYKSN